MSVLFPVSLWFAIAVTFWFAAGPFCRRLNLTAAPDRAIVGMLLGIFVMLAGLFAMAAISA